MPKIVPLWFCRGMWVISLLVGVSLVLIYAQMPVDGATGDLDSYTAAGFRVKRLLEQRENGLQVDDIIVRAGGYTTDEWISGAGRGIKWERGSTVTYEILREGQPITLHLRMEPVPIATILRDWWLQILVSLALVIIAGLVFVRRPDDNAARLMVIFCLSTALHNFGDAFDFQYAILTRPAILWFQFLLEYISFVLIYGSILNFTLVFPEPFPGVWRYPRLTTAGIYFIHPLAIILATLLSPLGWRAIKVGSSVSWIIALLQALTAVTVGIISVRRVKDPVGRAQLRWILWGAAIGLMIVIPGYVVPLALSMEPRISHALAAVLTITILIAIAIPILRLKLFDIEIMINRTLVYGTLSMVLGALYLLLVRFFTQIAQVIFHGQNDTLVVMIASISIALAFNPLRQRVQQLIDRSFFRQKLNYQGLLPEITERLVTSVHTDQLAALLTGELPRRLQIEKAGLLVLDLNRKFFSPAHESDFNQLSADHALLQSLAQARQPLMRLLPPKDFAPEASSWLEEHGIELVIPLATGDELVGVYMLGRKQSGKVYTSEEVRVLKLVGQQAAVGVQNSRLFQAEQEQRRLAESLSRHTSRLLEERIELFNRTREQALEMQQIMDTVPEGVLLLDEERVILLANPVAQGYLDTLAEGVRPGQTLSILGDKPVEAFLNSEPLQPWIEMNDADPPGRVFEIAARPLKSEAQKAGWVLVLREVTRERAIQSQIQMQERLVTVGQLAAGIAHDFNNIMASILVYADMLSLDEGISDASRERLKIIQEQIRRATGLIRQILDFSRRSVFERAPVDLLTLIEETQRLLKQVLPQNMRLELSYPAGEYMLMADAARLQQAFINLALNARDAMPSGGRLSFELSDFQLKPDERPPSPELEHGEWIQINVADTGTGIPADILAHIFDPFFTTKPVGKGSGLGLAQVYGIVKQHGGSIEVQSIVGEGTTFSIYLPRLVEEENATSYAK